MAPDKFEKVVLMLSSDQPGEVFAAAQAIGRALPDSGLDWHQFARLVAGRLGARPGKTQAEVHEKNNESYRAAEREYQPNDNNISQAEIGMVSMIVHDHIAKLNEREAGFIRSLADRINTYGPRTFLSPKQRKWLAEIWERL